MKTNIWTERLNKVIALPQRHQRDALRILGRSFSPNISEEWNTQFNQDSLYEAWSQILPMRNLYEVNRNIINKKLEEISDFTIVEIGGGNGALWRNLLNKNSKGNFILIDPVEDSHNSVAQNIPDSVNFTSIKSRIQDLENIPSADIIVCSLVLHHIPGADKAENLKYGIESQGKADIISRLLEGIRKKDGILILNESDVYTDIKMPAKSHFLFHRLIDSYVRRCAKSISFMMEFEEISDDLYKKLEHIIIKWCINQVEIACNASLTERDVYELDMIHWLELFENVGANVISHKISDEWHLFHQYILK